MSVTAKLDYILGRMDWIRDCELNRRSAHYEECPNLREGLRREFHDLRIKRDDLEREIRKMYGER